MDTAIFLSIGVLVLSFLFWSCISLIIEASAKGMDGTGGGPGLHYDKGNFKHIILPCFYVYRIGFKAFRKAVSSFEDR